MAAKRDYSQMFTSKEDEVRENHVLYHHYRAVTHKVTNQFTAMQGGGDQVHSTQRFMKHKTFKVSGVRMK